MHAARRPLADTLPPIEYHRPASRTGQLADFYPATRLADEGLGLAASQLMKSRHHTVDAAFICMLAVLVQSIKFQGIMRAQGFTSFLAWKHRSSQSRNGHMQVKQTLGRTSVIGNTGAICTYMQVFLS